MARKVKCEKNLEKALKKELKNWKLNIPNLRVDANVIFDNEDDLKKWVPWYGYGQDRRGHMTFYVELASLD